MEGYDPNFSSVRQLRPSSTCPHLVVNRVRVDIEVRKAIWLTSRNVPGVAIYFYALSAIRTELSYIQGFQTYTYPTIPSSTTSTLEAGSGSTSTSSTKQNGSALVKLSVPGNLIAGAIARTSVGFILNPITVLKARYEVCPDFLPLILLILVSVKCCYKASRERKADE